MTHRDQPAPLVGTIMAAPDCGPNLHGREAVRSRHVLARPKRTAGRRMRGLASTAVVTPAILAAVVALWPSSAASQTADAPQAMAVCAQNFPTATELACGAGSNAAAAGGATTAIGVNALANFHYATALGHASKATADGSTAVGVFAAANGSWSLAVGNVSVANGVSATALGDASKATANFSTALGGHSAAGGANSTAIGNNSTANFANSMALGMGVSTTAPNQIAVGTAANTYLLPGLTSAASLSSQTGVVRIVTSDAAGHLATMPVGGSPNAWALVGNTITATDFIGTNIAMPFVVKTNAFERMRITPAGWIGIGTPTPKVSFEVHNAANPIILISTNTAGGRLGVASCAGCFSGVAALDDFVVGNDGGARDMLLTSRSDHAAGGAIRFATGTISGAGDTEKMRITKAGRIGIGTPTPNFHLDVHNAVNPVLGISTNTAAGRLGVASCASCFSGVAALDDFVIGNDGGARDMLLTSRSDHAAGGAIRFATGTISGPFPADTEKMRLTKAGDLGVGTTNPTTRLHVAGMVTLALPVGPTQLCYSGTTASAVIASCTGSDARLKTNVLSLSNTLDKLEHVRGVSFEWTEQYRSRGELSERREIGVLAQEVERVFPELVSLTDDGYRRVDYGRLTAVLIEAVKELRNENNALTRRTEALERALIKP